jgi:predicted dinucleotide-utilizing enzyme
MDKLKIGLVGAGSIGNGVLCMQEIHRNPKFLPERIKLD